MQDLLEEELTELVLLDEATPLSAEFDRVAAASRGQMFRMVRDDRRLNIK